MSAAVMDKDEDKPQRGQPIKGRRALDSLPARSRTTGKQALARSRLVRRLRIALPVFALVLIAAFLFNTQSNTVDQAFLDDFEDMSATADELKMANPHFAGVDDEGRPFKITADAARQVPGQRDVVDLDAPRAVQGEENEATVVTAKRGVYQSTENILDLRDSVTLSHVIGDDTYILRTPSARVSIKDEVVTAEEGVGGAGSDGGALRADRMQAFNAQGRVVFEGNVRMRIYPKSAQKNLDKNNKAPLESEDGADKEVE